MSISSHPQRGNGKQWRREKPDLTEASHARSQPGTAIRISIAEAAVQAVATAIATKVEAAAHRAAVALVNIQRSVATSPHHRAFPKAQDQGAATQCSNPSSISISHGAPPKCQKKQKKHKSTTPTPRRNKSGTICFRSHASPHGDMGLGAVQPWETPPPRNVCNKGGSGSVP